MLGALQSTFRESALTRKRGDALTHIIPTSYTPLLPLMLDNFQVHPISNPKKHCNLQCKPMMLKMMGW